jgi:hypothetical protein
VAFRFIPRPLSIVSSQVKGEIFEVGKGIRLIVLLGPESKALVVLHRSRDFSHAENWLLLGPRRIRPLCSSDPMPIENHSLKVSLNRADQSQFRAFATDRHR